MLKPFESDTGVVRGWHRAAKSIQVRIDVVPLQFTVAVAGERLTLDSLSHDGTRCTLSATGRLESGGHFRWRLPIQRVVGAR